jgi:hypothetical protein
VAERANDEILQLAGQGNLQALSVYLNRHLIPSGAHVKVKQKEEALHVLIVVMSESENAGLINTVQNLVVRIRPTHVKRVKVYTQVLGQKQASLRKQFSMKSADESQLKSAPVSSSPEPPPLPSRPSIAGSSSPSSEPEPSLNVSSASAFSPASIPSASTVEPHRYSVAEFLAQATNLEELKVLHNHPFFTGVCPDCRHQFPKKSQPPTYWDCPKCGWKDDLSGVMPRQDIRNSNGQISLAESKRLGDYLVEAGLLKPAQIEIALADQGATGLRFGEVLIRRGWVKEETIEYLMQKIILPERRGDQNAAAYLESSRNLLKTLLKVKPDSQAAASPFISPPAASAEVSTQPQRSGQDSKKSSERITIPPKKAPVISGKMANERETLILPDVELDELDAYLNGSFPK